MSQNWHKNYTLLNYAISFNWYTKVKTREVVKGDHAQSILDVLVIISPGVMISLPPLFWLDIAIVVVVGVVHLDLELNSAESHLHSLWKYTKQKDLHLNSSMHYTLWLYSWSMRLFWKHFERRQTFRPKALSCSRSMMHSFNFFPDNKF